MSELVVFVFRDQYRAPEVLNDLRRRDWAWTRDLEEAIALTITEEGRARVYLSVDLTRNEAAGWARVWGALLSTTVFQPVTDLMVDTAQELTFSPSTRDSWKRRSANSWEAEWWRQSLNASLNFKRDVGALMSRGGSAIFMLLRDANVAAALKQLCNYGDTVLHTAVSAEQDRKMFAVLAGG